MGAPNRYNASTPVSGVTLVDATTGDPVSIGGGTAGTPSVIAGGTNTAPASAANPLPVRGTLGTATDRSGTITAGGTAQQIAAANTSRNSLTGQNLSTTEMWASETATAAGQVGPNLAGCYLIAAGGTFKSNGNGAFWLYGATTGQRYAATETQ